MGPLDTSERRRDRRNWSDQLQAVPNRVEERSRTMSDPTHPAGWRVLRIVSTRPIRSAILLTLVLTCGFRAQAADDLFETQVAAIFERHCVRCHNAESAKGGLSLADAAGFRQGGDSGPILDADAPEASLLLEVITGDTPQMPKGTDPLGSAEIAAIRAWLKEGASWPAERRLVDRQFAGGWWSLQPLVRPDVPQFPRNHRQARFLRNPIDAFVLRELEANGLEPAEEADRRTLIRRLYFDLVGLPPTPAEIDRFLNDNDSRAYENLVDRLLQSPRYGERWARHWLDVVHFGETHGYDKDKPRPNAWPYRDYVIRALNNDTRYGRFLEEQIAGDALFPGTQDGIEALGFLSAGPWDFIGHAEVPETKIDGRVARHLDRDDMVTNTMQTFASFTVQCAQCHNHKFDPITQEDYYSLQAVFAAIDRTDRAYDIDPQIAERRQGLVTRRAALDQRRTEIEQAIRERAGEPLQKLDARIAELQKSASAGALQGAEFGYHSQIEPKQDVEKWVQVNLKEPVAAREIVLHPCHDDFNGIGAGFGFPVRYRVESAANAEFTRDVTVIADFTASDVAKPGLKLQVLPAAERGTKEVQYVRVTATRLAPRSNDYILALAELEIRDESGKNRAQGASVTALDSIEAPPRWRAANLTDGLFPRVEGDGTAELAKAKQARETLWNETSQSAERDELATLVGEREQVVKEIALLPPQRVAYIGAVHTGEGAFRGTGHDGGRPRPISLLERGNVEKPVKPVGPGALSAISTLPARFPIADSAVESERRAALARWLSDTQNPLTWRSIVNRVWHYHFGKGLVESPNDFGRNGRRPSHPELLNWLAVEFRDGGQSLKELHRLITCSGTYRQSTRESARAAEIDAENRLLSRMNRRRLEAEAIRDSVLAVSGRLDLTMYGPSFQDFVIEKPEHSPHYEYELADPNDPKIHRRSVYRFIVRSQQQPFMTTLDCADPSMQVDRRNESLSALQALALLNNGFMLTMAERYAEKLQMQSPQVEQQVARAILECTGRSLPEPDEQELVAYARQHGLANLCRLLFNLNEFVFVD